MKYFEIKGGRKLEGEITPQGAKNEALQVISAILLTPEKVTISNIPDIIDVRRLIEILSYIGVEVTQVDAHCYTFHALKVDMEKLLTPEFKKLGGGLRGSIMLMGPLLARFGKAFMAKPGGDKIGRRRLDSHFIGFEKLGAKFHFDRAQNFYSVLAEEGLTGTYIHMDEPSVTGTANIIMAASMAKGVTTIYFAACEPYIQQLCKLINSMGGKISGIGSNKLIIEGVKELGAANHRILADMIEVGSFIGMAAMTQGSVRIKNANVEYLGQIPDVFRRMGVDLEIEGDDIIVHEKEVCKIQTYIDGSVMTISDNPWPGFTPDLLSIVLVLATQCEGTVLIHQKMFESRLFFVDKLIDMGAKIILCDPHRATVIGMGRRTQLRGISMSSPDIRAGVSLLIAALSAKGTSRIYNIDQIDRGYQDIERRLTALGASIKRLED